MRRRGCCTAGARTTFRRASSTSCPSSTSSASGCGRRRGRSTARPSSPLSNSVRPCRRCRRATRCGTERSARASSCAWRRAVSSSCASRATGRNGGSCSTTRRSKRSRLSRVTFEFRPVRDRDEFARAFYAIGQYFAGPPPEDMLDRWFQYHELERMHAAFDGKEVVGGAGAFTFDMSVPGGSLPCAGVTVVGVYPTHRRRGALRSMMDAQLRDVHERGEPIAALWASEETIYGRFGYGLAAWCGEMKLPREWSSFAQPLERRGQVRFVTPDEAKELFPPVWEELRRQRSGVFARTPAWWEVRNLRLPPEQEANPKKFVVLDLDGSVAGYAIYRTHLEFEGFVSTGRTEVIEAVATSPQETAELWRYLCDIDWSATITSALLPLDHPLFLLLANPRRLSFTTGDSLWVRLVDVGAALSGRKYAGEGRIVFDVRDAVCPWNEGRWALENGQAERTEEAADIALDVDVLGSAYLGAVSFAELRDALRLEELEPGAVARADAVFAWRPLPWCPEIF